MIFMLLTPVIVGATVAGFIFELVRQLILAIRSRRKGY